MKNVTVTMAEDALESVGEVFARGNGSISLYRVQLVDRARARYVAYERPMRAALKFQSLIFPTNARYLSRDEANGHAGLC